MADSFYRQVTDEHFARATSGQKRNAECDAFATQNPTQQVSARRREEAQETTQPQGSQGVGRNTTKHRDMSRNSKIGPGGTEYTPYSSGNTDVSESCNAESNALSTGGVIDPELQAIFDAWSTLPGAIKAGILAIVRTARE